MNHQTKIIGWRKCEICGKDMPITNRRLDAKYCSKKCRRVVFKLHFPDYNKQYYQKNKERMKEKNRENYLVKRKENLVRAKIWREKNKDKKKEQDKKWRTRNRDKIRTKDREYYHNIRRFDKDYRAKVTLRQKKKRLMPEGKVKMKEENYKRRFSKHIWVIRKKGYIPSNFLKWQLVKKFKGINECYYCGSKKELALDHIAPLSKYNINEIWNFVLACKTCNSSKKDKDPSLWAKEKSIKLPLEFIENFSKTKLQKKSA